MKYKINKNIEKINSFQMNSLFLNKIDFKLHKKQKIDLRINEPASKKKKNKFNGLIILMLNVIIIVIVLLWQNNTSSEKTMSLSSFLSLDINWWYFVIAFAVFVIINLIDLFITSALMKKTSKRFRLATCYKSNSMSRYYDLITPFGMGGQPYQIFYLSKRNVEVSNAIYISSSRYVAYMIGFVFISIAMLISREFFVTSIPITVSSAISTIFALIGLSFYIIILLFLIVISVNKGVANKIIKTISKISYKLKLTKNVNLLYYRMAHSTLQFQKQMKSFFSNFNSIFLILLSCLKIFLQLAIPFVLYCAFESFSTSMLFEFTSLAIMIDLSCRFIPLPGGSGMAELTFTALFSALFANGTVFWIMIVWRILTYYGYILQGFLIVLYDNLVGNKKLYNKNYLLKVISKIKNKKIQGK